MPTFPQTPRPSHISVPTFIDPILRYTTDAGYEIRRSRTSRVRRRFTLEWLGRSTEDMRTIRDFVLETRMGALTFDWFHNTAVDFVPVFNTTPIILQWNHGLRTGQWIYLAEGPSADTFNVVRQVTRLNSAQVSLNGTTAGGAGTASVLVYLPQAITVFNEDTWTSPTKLIGPEHITSGIYRSGAFSWSITIEEVF